MSDTSKVRMHATAVYYDSGRMVKLIRGGEYTIPTSEAENFQKNGMAYIVSGPKPKNKSLGAVKNVKLESRNEPSQSGTGDRPRRKRGRPRGSKNISKN